MGNPLKRTPAYKGGSSVERTGWGKRTETHAPMRRNRKGKWVPNYKAGMAARDKVRSENVLPGLEEVVYRRAFNAPELDMPALLVRFHRKKTGEIGVVLRDMQQNMEWWAPVTRMIREY